MKLEQQKTKDVLHCRTKFKQISKQQIYACNDGTHTSGPFVVHFCYCMSDYGTLFSVVHARFIKYIINSKMSNVFQFIWILKIILNMLQSIPWLNLKNVYIVQARSVRGGPGGRAPPAFCLAPLLFRIRLSGPLCFVRKELRWSPLGSLQRYAQDPHAVWLGSK